MKATIKDLELELWLRKRERGEIVWTTKSGAEIPINEMSDTHIKNAIKKNEKIEETYDWMFD